MPATSTRTIYFTILARNYLAKAVALADSLRRHHPDAELVVVFIDVLRDQDLPALPDLPGVRLASTEALGLPERKVLRLATIYNLVEFATAIKPVLFRRFLEEAEQAVYLDPDTYVTSPMVELPFDLAATEGGILLTPHYLAPVDGEGELGEGHLLHVGFYNLGFCAVDRRARAFLDWWWGHLEWECLWDPMSGLFVDQKWVDLGAGYFAAGNWRHAGYNVSIANLHERPIASDDEGYYIASTGDRLRLFHFHAFDTSAPTELSTRFASTAHLRTDNAALDSLCVEYAEALIKNEQMLPEAPPYPYFTDTRGRRISRQLRRAYRLESEGGADLPSPFVAAEADAFDAWRRHARRLMARELVGDAAKSFRLALPEEYTRMKGRFPALANRVRSRFVRSSGIWS